MLPTPPRTTEKMGSKRKRSSKKGSSKSKRPSKKFKASLGKSAPVSTTYQHDRAVEYKAGRMTKGKKRALNFKNKVFKAMQQKMAPNHMLFNVGSTNLSVASNAQGVYVAELFSANGVGPNANDLYKIFNQVGGPTSATQGYTYDLMFHTGILEVDMCLETSALAVAQGFIDVYTVVCRRDIVTEANLSTTGNWSHH